MSRTSSAPAQQAASILNFIGGEFVAATSAKTFDKRSPVDPVSKPRHGAIFHHDGRFESRRHRVVLRLQTPEGCRYVVFYGHVRSLARDAQRLRISRARRAPRPGRDA